MRPEKTRTQFGQLLLLARINRNMLQKQLAFAATIDPSYLAGIESGRRPVPRAEVLASLFGALNLTANERKNLEEAAAWGQIASYLEKSASAHPKIHALTRISKIFAVLSERQATSLVTLVESLTEENIKGPIME